MKTYHYLKGEKCIKDFKQPVSEEDSPLYLYVKLFKTLRDEKIENIIKFMRNTILLALYFSQYKYLLNLLSYEKVKSVFKIKIDLKELAERESKAKAYINKLTIKEILISVQKCLFIIILQNSIIIIIISLRTYILLV